MNDFSFEILFVHSLIWVTECTLIGMHGVIMIELVISPLRKSFVTMSSANS